MKNLFKEISPSLIIAIFGLTILILIPIQINQVNNQHNMGPSFFPKILAISIIIFNLIFIVGKIIGFYRFRKNNEASTDDSHKQSIHHFKVLLVLGISISWIVLNELLGFILSTFITILISMIIMGNRKYIQIILVPLLFTGITYFLFVELLNISL